MSKRNVVHIEIPAANVQSASRFYESLFGWKMEHAAEFDYTMWSDGSGYGGGFNKLSDENPVGQVLVCIDSDDIEADLRQVEQLGGTVVMPKTEIPGTGWFGMFKDPTGNQYSRGGAGPPSCKITHSYVRIGEIPAMADTKPPTVVELVWDGRLKFTARAGDHEWVLDGRTEEGPSPVMALAAALAGCMAIDVVHILTKGRFAIHGFRTQLTGRRADSEPRRFVSSTCGS